MKHKIFIELTYIAIIIYAIWYISDLQNKLSVVNGRLIEQREVILLYQEEIVKQRLLIDAQERYINSLDNREFQLYKDRGQSPIYNDPL